MSAIANRRLCFQAVVLLAVLLAAAPAVAETIPLLAQQTAPRTVQLTWTGTYGSVVVSRQYPDQPQYVDIGATSDNSWTDRQHRSAPLPAATRDGGIGSFSWLLDSATAHVRLTVSGNADLYGVLVDDGPGIAVDNIPMRGCSGQQFTLVPEDKLASAYRQLDVGMIILQFGGNSVPYIKTSKQISTYCQSIGKQIDHLHRCCPGATLLFVGPSDMSTRLRGQLQTYPALPELIDSLAATATTHGAAYWSIYHAMGGLNSMPEWSRQGLAGQDYIHFSQRGADLMGDRLSQALDNSYRLFCLERKMKQEKAKHVQ